MIIMNRRAERAAYAQLEGQPGAVGAVLRSSLRRGWRGSEVPVAVNGRTKDAVYRVVGRPGVTLIVEGPKARTQRLTDEERRKVTRVAPNVPVTVLHVGHDEGSIRLNQISRRLTRLKPKLTRRRGARGEQPPRVARHRPAGPEGHRPDEDPRRAQMSAGPRPMTRIEAAALLGVPPGTTGQDAKRAFLRAARFAHPDVLPQAGEDERRAAADRFDALVQARAVLLEPPFTSAADGPPRASARPVHVVPRQDRGLAGSLVLIALLSFLIVALVTLDSSLRSQSGDGSANGAPIVSSPAP